MYDFDQKLNRNHTGSLKWNKYAGRDVLPLWVADMDFTSPPEVIEALHKRAAHGVFGYTIPYEEVLGETLKYLQRQHGITVSAESLIWVPGLVPALNVACRAFGEAGSGVMINTPVYPPFLSAPIYSDRKRISVPLVVRNETWQIDWEAMEKSVTPDTKLFVLCHPHNPVGRVWTRDELLDIFTFCERHNLVVVSDEIHCDLILDDLPHVAALSLGEKAASRCIAMYAPSKTYNLPGLACAFVVIPDETLRKQFRHTARGIITEINAFGYAGCAAAYQYGEPWRQDLINYLRANRDLVYDFVRDHLPGITMLPMSATYLAWLDVRALNLEMPAKFFEDHGVGLSNGIDFGAPGFLRLNFGCPRSVLQEGLDRMARAFSNR